MKILYIEFKKSVKFYHDNKSLEIKKSKFLVNFLRAIYKKYDKNLIFEDLRGLENGCKNF